MTKHNFTDWDKLSKEDKDNAVINKFCIYAYLKNKKKFILHEVDLRVLVNCVLRAIEENKNE